MPDEPSPRYGVPRATYRLQLTPEFGFREAAEVVPYLARLGVSHVYLSPFFEAVAGSQHGYDVTDHNQVRRELGGLGGLYLLNDALVAHGLGLVADVVPNHVGVGAGNGWWMDVLRYGGESPYAHYFDIDWEAQPQMERGVIWYPLLGQPFGRTLEAGEIRLGLVEMEPVVQYYDHVLPVTPAYYGRLFGMPPAALGDELSDPTAAGQLADVMDELRTSGRDQSELLRARFRDILSGEPALRAWAEESVEEVNGSVGDPSSFDGLEALLLEQHYRLADWRVSGEEINYRRFFDQNGLAAIRVEREEVFEEVHRLLLDLVSAGIVTGVRIDHVDGLYDPGSYLARLRARLDDASKARGHVPIFVEKILEAGEALPAWDIEGTTGYELLGTVGELLVDGRGYSELREHYRRFTGERQSFEDASYAAKSHVASIAFSGELNVLAWQLYRIAQRHRLHRDNTLRSLRRAISGTLACFPVYRTYMRDDLTEGRDHIERAVREAFERDPTLSPAALDFLREVLGLEGELDDEEHARRLHFRRRFQQLSGPVMAKGVEDTAFYRYAPLLSQCEVGSSPAGVAPVSEVHTWMEQRWREWPDSMSATSTHDTKRSEDVRARLAVLSEVAGEWRREASTWARMNERYAVTVGGERAPTRSLEWYLYQTLVGTWPEAGVDAAYVDRISEHMLKAMREAKLETSWLSPDEAYEGAVIAFVKAILRPRGSVAFQRRVKRMVDEVAGAGALNSLAMVTLKSLAPGFPDIYQGTEIPAFALTDPDNRRPVDFGRLSQMLDDLKRDTIPGSHEERKLWLTSRLLEIRRVHHVARCGRYVPLPVSGPRREHVFAFERVGENERLVVAVPRLPQRMGEGEHGWAGTEIGVEGAGWTNLLTGQRGRGGDCAELFRQFPVAVLLVGGARE